MEVSVNVNGAPVNLKVRGRDPNKGTGDRVGGILNIVFNQGQFDHLVLL